VSPECRVIRPGDTVIIRVDPASSQDAAKRAADTLKSRLPGVNVVIVGVAQLEVYRPSDSTSAEEIET
jgi:calcineurin-like phosphoesterase family protein